MNSMVETLNLWGAGFAHLLWPIFWQSSLLIALLFALDLVFRKRVRAAVRYAFWLVVLVKLVLPPSFASPSSAAWWLRPGTPPPQPLRAGTIVVTYPDAPVSPALPVTEMIAPRPAPALSAAAWFLIASCGASVALLLWLLIRWGHMAADTREAAPAAGELEVRLKEAMRQAGLRGSIPLRVTHKTLSPAVCGLFRPVLLLPESMIGRLAENQLRAVLLHELIHVRRQDVRVNFIQALLQIVYWWHPLVWVANARIQRLREEAVDDAVMLALREEADGYAPTLLAVAKLTFRRPLASLGLVGILESKNALRQRIERLVHFNAPSRAGLSMVSILAIAAFSAIAVPMGEAPNGSATTAGGIAWGHAKPGAAFDISVHEDGSYWLGTNQMDLLQLGIRLSRATQTNPDTEVFIQADKNVRSQAMVRLMDTCRTSGVARVSTRILPEEPRRNSANAVEEGGLAAQVLQHRSSEIPTSTGRQTIMRKLDQIRLDRVQYDNQSLDQVLQALSEEVKKGDPDGQGINLLLNPSPDYQGPTIDSNTGLPLGPTGEEPMDLSAIRVTIEPALTNARLADVLGAIVAVASRPIKYSVVDYAVVFSPKAPDLPELHIRSYNIHVPLLLERLHDFNGTPTNAPRSEVLNSLLSLFDSAGISLHPETGRNLFLDANKGTLIVRATEEELGEVEKFLVSLMALPPQVNLRVKFVELPINDRAGIGFDWYLGNFLMNNATPAEPSGGADSSTNAGSTPAPGVFPRAMDSRPLAGTAANSGSRASGSAIAGILTDPEYRAVMRALQQRKDVELLNEGQVTTLSGRQAQIAVANLQFVATNINPRALQPPGIPASDESNTLYQTALLPLGPMLDVIPSVQKNHSMIDLILTPTFTEFLGYNPPTNSVVAYVDGKPRTVSVPKPNIRIHSVTNNVTIWDGQTVVLGLSPSASEESARTSNGSMKQLLVFVTATLIDSAGNRIHTDDELPFARDSIPPQGRPTGATPPSSGGQ